LCAATLKEAITVHIIKENLSFKYVESPSLAELLRNDLLRLHYLCNASVPEMLVKADSIAEHVISKYFAAKEKIKIFFQSVSSKISVTCDLWTSPNGKAILCVTSHWTDKDHEVRESILDAKKIERPHKGENIASHILVVLKDFLKKTYSALPLIMHLTTNLWPGHYLSK
jgi:hypothetical protein